MKKAFLFAALAAAFIALTGCKKENVAPYGWFLEVKNDTDREIVISSNTNSTESFVWFDGTADNYGSYASYYGGYGSTDDTGYYGGYYTGYGPDSFIIAPGRTGTVRGVYAYASADSGTTQPDRFRPDDVLPFGTSPVLDITLDAVGVPGGIWVRKHWSFRGTEHDRIYTLTVTDALLAEIAAAAE